MVSRVCVSSSSQLTGTYRLPTFPAVEDLLPSGARVSHTLQLATHTKPLILRIARFLRLEKLITKNCGVGRCCELGSLGSGRLITSQLDKKQTEIGYIKSCIYFWWRDTMLLITSRATRLNRRTAARLLNGKAGRWCLWGSAQLAIHYQFI
jgi:hypothetical protein